MATVSEETRKALQGARTEIVAGGVLVPKSEADRTWNRANDRAARIIDSYLSGQGLFQVETKEQKVEPTKRT